MAGDLRVLLYGRKPKGHGGTERVFLSLAEALRERVATVDMAYVGEEDRVPEGADYDVIHANAAFKRAPKLLRRVDAPHVFTVHCSPWRNTVHGWETGRRGLFRIPQAFFWSEEFINHYRTARRSAAVLVTNEENERDLKRQLPGLRDRVVRVPLGIHTDRFPVGEEDGGYAFFCGRLEASKGIDLAVDVLTELGYPFKIAGTGSLEGTLKRRAGPNVEFLGPVDDKALADLYARASVCVFPSLMEGFGLVALEALSAGAPTVVSDAFAVPPPAQDLLRIAPRRDHDAFRDAIRDAWATKTPEWARRAHTTVRDHHDFGLYADRVVDVYERVTADGGKSDATKTESA